MVRYQELVRRGWLLVLQAVSGDGLPRAAVLGRRERPAVEAGGRLRQDGQEPHGRENRATRGGIHWEAGQSEEALFHVCGLHSNAPTDERAPGLRGQVGRW